MDHEEHNLGLPTWLGIVSTLSRLIMAGVWIVSGFTKIQDMNASHQAVRAYDILPPAGVDFVALVLPPAELLLGILLLMGVFLRPLGIVSALVQCIFIAGIISAWARGLQLDCGCFGDGGYDPTVGPKQYMIDIARDLGFVVLSIIVAVFPSKLLALYPGKSAR